MLWVHLYAREQREEECRGGRAWQRWDTQVQERHQPAFWLPLCSAHNVFLRHSSFELQTADILLTTLLAQDMFPSHDTLDDLMTSTVTYLAHQRKRSAHVTPGGAAEGHTEREEKSDEHEEEVQVTVLCMRDLCGAGQCSVMRSLTLK